MFAAVFSTNLRNVVIYSHFFRVSPIRHPNFKNALQIL
jgi:hypothetical protein